MFLCVFAALRENHPQLCEPRVILGYNTNGFAHHRLADAVAILSEIGYVGVALTPDVHHLDPFADDLPEAIEALANHRLTWVIETGARFVLNARRKHFPTLIDPYATNAQIRFDFLRRMVGVASKLGAPVLSFWSGAGIDDAATRGRLADWCRHLADAAAAKNVRLAFEPEPGMVIDTMDKFADLHAAVNHPNFGLTLDVGHLVCTGELPISQHILHWKDWLWNVHIEDMKPGVHDHLLFGEGTVDFDDVFAGLRGANYAGMVSVELSRHSYDAVTVARKAFDFLAPFVTVSPPSPPLSRP